MMDLDSNETLFKEGLVSELSVKVKRSQVDELKNRLAIEQERLEDDARGYRVAARTAGR